MANSTTDIHRHSGSSVSSSSDATYSSNISKADRNPIKNCAENNGSNSSQNYVKWDPLTDGRYLYCALPIDPLEIDGDDMLIKSGKIKEHIKELVSTLLEFHSDGVIGLNELDFKIMTGFPLRNLKDKELLIFEIIFAINKLSKGSHNGEKMCIENNLLNSLKNYGLLEYAAKKTSENIIDMKLASLIEFLDKENLLTEDILFSSKKVNEENDKIGRRVAELKSLDIPEILEAITDLEKKGILSDMLLYLVKIIAYECNGIGFAVSELATRIDELVKDCSKKIKILQKNSDEIQNDMEKCSKDIKRVKNYEENQKIEVPSKNQADIMAENKMCQLEYKEPRNLEEMKNKITKYNEIISEIENCVEDKANKTSSTLQARNVQVHKSDIKSKSKICRLEHNTPFCSNCGWLNSWIKAFKKRGIYVKKVDGGTKQHVWTNSMNDS